MVNKLDIDPITHPYVYDGVEYAKDVLAGKIVACVYVIGACNRFFKDIDKGYFIFDIDKAERYLRLVQLFNHVKGVWSTPNITYDPWQNFCFMNIMGWIDPRTGSRRFRSAHLELARGQGKSHALRQEVVTPEGIKNWGEIEVGSQLYSRDGTICNVVGKTPITKQRVWEVEFSDGSIVECSGEHEWFTSTIEECEKSEESIKETREIRDTLLINRKFNHVVWPAIKTPYTRRYIVDVRETDRFEDQFCVEVDSKDHSYLIGDSLIPTHNSAMASQAVLFFLALDNPVGNEISCVSTKKDAARIVLDSARAMAKKSKKYLQKTNVKVLAHKIVHDESNSFARALSSDSESLDGLNDILAVMDELHAVQRKLFDVINSGMKKRRDSLMLCITTAGFNKDGVGYSQSQYAKKVALGEVEDDQMFAIVYTLDKGDDIYDSKNWIKANPSLGTSVDPIALEAAIKKTREVPADLPNVMVKNLNIWLDEANAYFSMDKWDECYDPTLDEKDFYKHTCFEAIDLSSKVDLSAKVKVFYDPTDGKYAIFQKAYIPRETFKESNSDIYAQSEGNELFVTEGSAIDYSVIEKDIEQDSTTTTLDSVFFDPWNAIHISQNLTKKGLNMVEFPQRVSTMSEPMKHLEALIREKKIKHNGGPLLRYCMANVVAKIDGNENVFPTKSSKLLKIDLAVALIMAMAGWLVREQTEKSVYESRGLRTL